MKKNTETLGGYDRVGLYLCRVKDGLASRRNMLGIYKGFEPIICMSPAGLGCLSLARMRGLEPNVKC